MFFNVVHQDDGTFLIVISDITTQPRNAVQLVDAEVLPIQTVIKKQKTRRFLLFRAFNQKPCPRNTQKKTVTVNMTPNTSSVQ